MDAAVALFICSVIRLEKYRFSYGRKWNLERMKESEIRLPVDASGDPDWVWMRRYILTQSFSSQLHRDAVDSEIARERLAEIETNPRALVMGSDLEARLSRLDTARNKSQ